MRLLLKWVLVCAVLVGPLGAEQRFIVRILSGLLPLDSACLVLGCNVLEDLEAPDNQLFLITTPDGLVSTLIVDALSVVPGVLDIEPDLLVWVQQTTYQAPPALYDTQPVPYFGVEVEQGYVTQPAAQIVGIQHTQTTFGVAGTGTVAVIDTGVDTTQPVLQNVLVPGYDFTRNQPGGSENTDLNQSTVAVVDGEQPADVNSYTVATVGQPNASTLNTPQYADFGHGTMVSGIVHLVAPQAMIMPLKAFQANGSGYTSDILRAIYWGTNAGARVINMSFSTPKKSLEMSLAIDYATTVGVICVASAGNSGLKTLVYPAAFDNVIGVGSTSNENTLSTFSNYGPELVWVGAPGEGVITTYPFGAYAAAWGTSFSAPFVSGTVALLLQEQWTMGHSQAAAALAHATPINSNLGNGLLNTYLAVQAVSTNP
jgi:subtilisin family serine protease